MIQRLAAVTLSVVLAVLLVSAAGAQPSEEVSALSKEIEALKAGQAAIQRDLQEIKALLRGAQAGQAAAPAEPQEVVVSVEGAPFKGDNGAKVTLVEFTDYQCPFCSRHFRQTWPQLEQNYVKRGKVKFVLRDLPLESIHPMAFKAAEASHCAGDQGKYWEMHDRLFASQNAIARKDLSAHAQAIGLDVAAFDKCVDSGKSAMRIRKDVSDSQKAGVRGTPTFFMGLTDPNSGQIKAVRVLRGAQPYETFREALDALLASAK